MRITESYAAHAKVNPSQMAIIDEKEKITYKEWHERVQSSAQWLKETPHQQKRVAFLVSNGVPFLQLFAGAASAGWTAVPLDPRWSDKECAEKLLLSDADLVIVEDRYIKRIEKYKLDMPVLSLSEWKERISINVQSNKGEPEEDPAFYMGFTSGSTGSPKAFIRRQQSWIESFQMTASVFGITHQDHVLILGTLLSSHFLYGAISTLYFGGTVTLLEKFVPDKAKNILERGDITAIYTVPTMTESLLQMDAFGKHPLLVLSSGADWETLQKNSSSTAIPTSHFLIFMEHQN